MQQQLDSKLVSKAQGAVGGKTLERIYLVLFWSLVQSLREKGWEVSIEPRAGAGYVDIRLHHRRKRMAVLIELKSSEKKEDMEKDANILNIHILREYGIAGFHLGSYVEGRYLELDDQNQWVEKDDPVS